MMIWPVRECVRRGTYFHPLSPWPSRPSSPLPLHSVHIDFVMANCDLMNVMSSGDGKVAWRCECFIDSFLDYLLKSDFVQCLKAQN